MDTLPATTQTLFGCAGLLSQNMQAVIMKQGTCALVRARGGGGTWRHMEPCLLQKLDSLLEIYTPRAAMQY